MSGTTQTIEQDNCTLTIDQHNKHITTYTVNISHNTSAIKLLLGIIVSTTPLYFIPVSIYIQLVVIVHMVAIYAYCIVTQVVMEQITAIKDIGIEYTYVTRWNHLFSQHDKHMKLITLYELYSVVINEGIQHNTVLYYLCVIIKNNSTMILPLQYSQPRYVILHAIYNGIHDTLQLS